MLIPITEKMSLGEKIAAENTNNQFLQSIIYPIGSVWIGGKNADGDIINPATIFGGTWELIDKEFESNFLSDDNTGKTFKKSSIVSSYVFNAVYSGRTIRLRLQFTPTIAISNDDSVEIGSFNLEKIGLNGFGYGISSVPAMSDQANGLAVATIGYSGEVFVSDYVKATTANQVLNICEEITCHYENILDNFCNRFYWKRTM